MFKILFLLGLVAMAYSAPAPVPKPTGKPDFVVPIVPDPELPNPVRFYDQPHQVPVQFYSQLTVPSPYVPVLYSQY